MVCDSLNKEVVKTVFKHYQVKDAIRVYRPTWKTIWRSEDALVVWHGRDTGSTLLFDYLCKVAPGSLYEVDYSHINQYGELGYSLYSIGSDVLINAGFGQAFSLVPSPKRREASADWSRLSKESLPLRLMCEDGIIRCYPIDYLEDWLLGITKHCLQGRDRVHIARIIGSALGYMIPSNDTVLPFSHFNKLLLKLSKSGRIVIADGYVINNDFIQQADTSWLKDAPNEWANYRRWKEKGQ